MIINPKILDYLNRKGYDTDEELEEFLSDKPRKMYDPFLLDDMEAGVDLILSAIEEGKKICVYGDYDADGVTASVLLADVLKTLTEDVLIYIPSRFDEGYGLNNDAIDTIKKAGAGLIVTVDCGSVSSEEVAYAIQSGLDILVTDHHTVKDKVADCIILNPMLPDSNYPFSGLAGVGVAFKLCQALSIVAGIPKSVLTRNMDLVAIGTVADIMPLVDENRTLVKYGLRVLNLCNRPGIREIASSINSVDLFKARDISFKIAPFINSCGRMGSAGDACKFLRADTEEKARLSFETLNGINESRKREQEKLFESCLSLYKEKYSDKRPDIVILKPEKSHEGIAGIVAGKIRERCNAPAIILSDSDDGYVKGTARSTDTIDIYMILKSCEHLYTSFGGHKGACGFTVKSEDIPEMEKIVNKAMEEILNAGKSLSSTEAKIDISLDQDDFTTDFIRELEILEPCGKENEMPMIAVESEILNMKRVGQKSQFLSVYARVCNSEKKFGAIAFARADIIEKKLSEKKNAVLIGTAEVDTYMGREKTRMILSEVI